MIGTPLYMSPEQYSGKKHSFKSDIWSLGCCMYEICNQKNAFEGATLNGVALKILKGVYSPVSTFYSPDLRSLIESMLIINPQKRPTISSILEKSFIKPRVINYMIDYISSGKKYCDEKVFRMHCEILKMQALKLGILDTLNESLAQVREKEMLKIPKVDNKLANSNPVNVSLTGFVQSQIERLEKKLSKAVGSAVLKNITKLISDEGNNPELLNLIKQELSEDNQGYILLVNKMLVLKKLK